MGSVTSVMLNTVIMPAACGTPVLSCLALYTSKVWLTVPVAWCQSENCLPPYRSLHR